MLRNLIVFIVTFSLFIHNQPICAGTVSFNIIYETNSEWEALGAPSQRKDNIESLLGSFANTIQTSGNYDTVIEVYVTDDTNGSGAAAYTQNAGDFYNTAHVPTAWLKTVAGLNDPNGTMQTNGTGADITINWNFGFSTPENNPGLFRHEMLHGLGMYTMMSNVLPTQQAGTQNIVYSNTSSTTASMLDLALVDSNGNPLLGNAISSTEFDVLNFTVDNNWADANKSGIRVASFGDDNNNYYIPLETSEATFDTDGFIDAAHPTLVSYAKYRTAPFDPDAGPFDWHFILESDRAILKALGYNIPEPTHMTILLIFSCMYLRRKTNALC